MYKPILTALEVGNYVKEVFAEADVYNWRVDDIRPGGATVSMQTGPKDIRPGGTVSGPTMFALADIAAYIITLAHVGRQPLAVTTNLSINFLSKPEPGKLIAEAEMIKLGKRLSVCEIRIYCPSGETGPVSGAYDSPENRLVAHATATYSVPPGRV